jgi:hypothetical protein
MAVKRLNLMDAITTQATALARGRTAIVRRGVISVLPGANAVAKVALGGGTVDAVCLTSAVLSVGDQVVVLGDTDAYWVVGEIGVGAAPPAAPVPVITDLAAGFTAQTGFTVDAATVARTITLAPARWVHLHAQVTRTGAPIVAPATGNITDTPLLLVPSTIQSTQRVHCHWTSNGTAGSGYLTTGGQLVISDMYPDTTLATGAVINLDVTYLF